MFLSLLSNSLSKDPFAMSAPLWKGTLSDIFSSNDILQDKNTPKVDVLENKDAFIIYADLPGMEKKDISITVEEGTLCIKGERKNDIRKEYEKYYHRERNYGKFSRQFNISDEISIKDIEAKMTNGVLEVILPKMEKKQDKTVEVKIL